MEKDMVERDADAEKQVENVQQKDASQTKHGGWSTMPYIMGNETFEKLASMSLIGSLVLYLTNEYNLDTVTASTTFSIWVGCCNFAPLIGAYIADTHLGKYWTLVVGTLCSSLGMWVLTVTAALPGLRPPKCIDRRSCIDPNTFQLGVLYLGLVLIAVGAGGIRPCNVAFGVDQFDRTTKKGKRQLQSFYNWYYFTFTLALIIALTCVAYVQNKVSWAYGLAIPALLMLISCLVFVLGRKLYVYIKPSGSVLIDIPKVVVASFMKRKLKGSDYPLYDPKQADTKLAKTDRFKCLNTASMITDEDMLDNQGAPLNAWRLCSVEQVEMLKSALNIFPLWISGIIIFVIMDQPGSYGIQQLKQMDMHISKHFEVPEQSLQISQMIALSIYIVFYEHLIIPLTKKLTRHGVTLKQRMVAGILISILTMLTSALVERRRRESALRHGTFVAPISFAWMIPQYMLSGLIEGLFNIALMEYYNSQLPQNMRSLANAIFFSNLSIADFVNTGIVNAVNVSGLQWLGGHDLNKNRIDKFYFLIMGLAIINLVYFLIFAHRYINVGELDQGNDTEEENKGNDGSQR